MIEINSVSFKQWAENEALENITTVVVTSSNCPKCKLLKEKADDIFNEQTGWLVLGWGDVSAAEVLSSLDIMSSPSVIIKKNQELQKVQFDLNDTSFQSLKDALREHLM